MLCEISENFQCVLSKWENRRGVANGRSENSKGSVSIRASHRARRHKATTSNLTILSTPFFNNGISETSNLLTTLR